MASSRKQSGSLSLPMMIAAFVVIGGFMFYLNQSSRAFRVEVSEASEAAVMAASEGDPGSAAALGDVASAPESFAGRRVQLSGLPIVSRVGEASFWVDTPSGSYFLVRMLPAVLETAPEIANGALATVSGTVHMMSDSVLAAWESNAVIDAGQRDEASFATAFIEVDQITVSGPQSDGL